MKTEIVRELIGSYERFNVYKTYFVTKDKDGQVVNIKPRWNEPTQWTRLTNKKIANLSH